MQRFQQLVETMPQGIKAVLKIKVGPMQYWQGVPNNVPSECTKYTVQSTHRDYKIGGILKRKFLDSYTHIHTFFFLNYTDFLQCGFHNPSLVFTF